MSEVIGVVATIIPQAGQEAQVEQALREAVRGTLGEDGCLRYELHRDVDQPRQLVMVERWRDEQALAAHMQAPAFQALAQVLEGRAELRILRLAPLD